jgi:ABC-type glycerol-3-phosphate transport system substrate-binding protein
VRVKSEEGTGGLLESLRAASGAAPQALPDVVVLSPSSLHAAALKGLIRPWEGVVDPPDPESWFAHTLEAASIDGVFYGLPLASDALIFAYRSSTFENAPTSWTRLLQSDRPWLFPAADPEALFTLAQYQALGGQLIGATGRPILDPTQLSRVLGFYASNRSAGLLHNSALQQDSVENTWNSLVVGRVDAAVARYSLLANAQDALFVTAGSLPTRSGQGISYASTLTWALVATEPSQQQLAGELLIWLSAPEFNGPWAEALGLLPPMSEALDHWSDGETASLAALLVTSLRSRPSEETLATFGPTLRTAVAAVLSEGMTPDEAALQAAQSIQSP